MAIAPHTEPKERWPQAQQQPPRLAPGAGAAGNTLFVTQLAVGSLNGVLERAVQVQTAVLNAIPALVALIDRSGVVLAVNGAWQSFARELGGDDELQGVGKSYFSIMPPTYASTAARATAGIREVLAGEAREFTTRYPSQTTHGKRWFKLLVAPLSAAGVEGAVVMHIDITDQVRAEMAARAAKLRAQTASQRKSEFLAKVSHELRTPLNAIMGYSEMLGLGMLGQLAPKQLEYIRDIHRSGQHLLGLLEDLIDLSKAEAGALEIDEQEARLDDVIAHCLRMVAPRARARDVLIEIGGGLGGTVVRGDARRLKQILLNLLTNAVKFTPARGQIHVSAARGADSWLRLAVRDTGYGIAPEELDLVRKPFGRSQRHVCYSQEGFGLGLPLVQQLAEAHDGRLELDSVVDAGTTATVLLPPQRVLSWGVERPAAS